MIIGIQNSWIINARTTNPCFFVGTWIPTGLTTSALDQGKWQRLENFAQRYAAPDARVWVYCLHERARMTELVSLFQKNEGTDFQPPGCSLPNSNGVRLPPWIKVPIPAKELDPGYLISWLEAKSEI